MAMVTIPTGYLLAVSSLNGEGWRQMGELGLALLLSALMRLRSWPDHRAAIWLTAAIGAAAGAGLPILAAAPRPSTS